MRAPGYDQLIENEVHVAKTHIRAFAVLNFVNVGAWHGESLTSTIKAINLIFFIVVEALVGKVLLLKSCDHLLKWFTFHLASFQVPQEMVMRKRWNIVELDEDEIIVNEATGDEWIWKAINWHGMIVYLHKLIDINFHLFDELF